MVDVFEHQLAWIAPGMKAEISVPAYPGRKWEGKVDYLYPELDPKTRTLRVRLVFPNPELDLKPNMFADVTIYGGPKKDVLTIPREALIVTGERESVVKALGEGRFQPVDVVTGMRPAGGGDPLGAQRGRRDRRLRPVPDRLRVQPPGELPADGITPWKRSSTGRSATASWSCSPPCCSPAGASPRSSRPRWTPSRTCPTCRSSSAPASPASRRGWWRSRSPTPSPPPCWRCPGPRRCAATPSSATPTSTSSSRTAPTSTGRAPGCWST